MSQQDGQGVNNERQQSDVSPQARDVEDRFIEVWGDISSLWGVNRTIGRMQALLYLGQRPMHMEELTTRLGISHGNSSTSVRDLLAWGVIRKVHLSGQRRVHYEAEQDPWTWFHTCIRERRRREVVPVIDALHEVEAVAHGNVKTNQGAEAAELERLHDQIKRFAKFSDEFVDFIDVFLAVGAGPIGKVLRSVAKLMPKGRQK